MKTKTVKCPKCKTPMILSTVSGGWIKQCYCREADNLAERLRKKERRKP